MPKTSNILPSDPVASQVRSVAFPTPAFALSASRDATVRLWKNKSTTPPEFDYDIKVHGTAFVNSLAFVPPSSAHPQGLVVSAGQDSIIDVREPGKAPEDNADALLLGHGHNVCALDVSEDGKYILSGSWDNDARIWPVGKWDTSTVLQGHTAAVWAVLSLDNATIITGTSHAPPSRTSIVLSQRNRRGLTRTP